MIDRFCGLISFSSRAIAFITYIANILLHQRGLSTGTADAHRVAGMIASTISFHIAYHSWFETRHAPLPTTAASTTLSHSIKQHSYSMSKCFSLSTSIATRHHWFHFSNDGKYFDTHLLSFFLFVIGFITNYYAFRFASLASCDANSRREDFINLCFFIRSRLPWHSIIYWWLLVYIHLSICLSNNAYSAWLHAWA